MVGALQYESAAVNAALLGILLLSRREFRVRSDEPSIRRAAGSVLFSLFVVYSYGMLGLYLLKGHFHGPFAVLDALEAVGRMYLGLSPGFRPETRRALWFVDSLATIGLGTLLYASIQLLRPVVWRQRILPRERAQARKIAERHGVSSLTEFTVRPDKHLFFNPTRTAYVGFRLVGDVALGLGDPIGPPGEVEPTAASFYSFATRNDWIPALYQVGSEHLAAYRQSGWQAVKVGEEAVIPLESFSFEGPSKKDLRYAINRFRKAGVHATLFTPPVSRSLVERLKPVSDLWLSGKGGRERTFSMGRFDLEELRYTHILVVEDAHGEVLAFANFVSASSRNMLSVDLMRHGGNPPNGLMDFLFSEAIMLLKEEGYAELSLGLAPLANVGTETGAGVPDLGARVIYERFNRLYNFKGLHTYKQKFSPSWEPRFLVYPNIGTLPKVALAVARADIMQPKD
jgi:phosphatidylglycerol lysyltransferase